MILNKFDSVSLAGRLKTISLQIFALGLLSVISCNKSGINANKSYVALTHVAYNVGPIGLALNGDTLFNAPLYFGHTTGAVGNHYDTTASKVSLMSIFLDSNAAQNIQGNAAFQQGARYSIFFFDILDGNSVSMIVLQDNPIILPDTFTYYRFMNFSPGDTLWGLKLINNRKDNQYKADTVFVTQSPFVGFNNNPSNYPMTDTIRTGNYSAFAFKNSTAPLSDSTIVYVPLGPIQIDSLVNYNIYLQGFYGDSTSANKFQLKYIPLHSR